MPHWLSAKKHEKWPFQAEKDSIVVDKELMSLQRISEGNDPGVTEETEKLPCLTNTTTRICFVKSTSDV